MEIKNVHPPYPAPQERQVRLEEVCRLCLAALAALRESGKENGKENSKENSKENGKENGGERRS